MPRSVIGTPLKQGRYTQELIEFRLMMRELLRENAEKLELT